MIKIVSGGQCGVDVAALRAAKANGLQTGGFIPEGCLTQDGPKPQYKEEYGLIEYGKGYKERTWKNVESAVLTIRIATDFSSAGEKCTLNAINKFNKPRYDIDLNKFDKHLPSQKIAVMLHCASLMSWYAGQDGVVNFAGNSEKTSPGIEARAYQIIDWILQFYINTKAL